MRRPSFCCTGRTRPCTSRRASLSSTPRRCAQAADAVGLDVVGDHRVHQQRHVAEHVVEDVGLFQVVEFVRLADEVAGREAAVGEVVEEHLVGHQPGTATTCQPVRCISGIVRQAPEVGDLVGADRQRAHASTKASQARPTRSRSGARTGVFPRRGPARCSAPSPAGWSSRRCAAASPAARPCYACRPRRGGLGLHLSLHCFFVLGLPCARRPRRRPRRRARERDVLAGQPAGVVRRQRDRHPVVDVAPLGVVVVLLGDEGDARHERERLHEVREHELARDRPAALGGVAPAGQLGGDGRPRARRTPEAVPSAIDRSEHGAAALAEADAPKAGALARAAQDDSVAVLEEARASRRSPGAAAACRPASVRAASRPGWRRARQRARPEQVARLQVAAVDAVVRDELRRGPVAVGEVGAADPLAGQVAARMAAVCSQTSSWMSIAPCARLPASRGRAAAADRPPAARTGVRNGASASIVTTHGASVLAKFFFARKGPSGWYSQACRSRAPVVEQGDAEQVLRRARWGSVRPRVARPDDEAEFKPWSTRREGPKTGGPASSAPRCCPRGRLAALAGLIDDDARPW